MLLIPSQVGLAFTADRGWYLEESVLTAADMDRLCDLADEREAARP